MHANKKKINWQPEHFPTGTIVVLENYEITGTELQYKKDGNCEVTVVSTIRNGLTSWLIRTTLFNDKLDMAHSLNFDHIKLIKKRGDGPVKIEDQYQSRAMPNLKGDISNTPMNKGKYFWYNSRELIRFLISLSSFPKNAYLKDGFYAHFLAQSFVKKEGHECWTVHSANKKKARRFIQQNINRWIVPMKEIRAAAEAESKREYEQYCRDLDDGFDGDYPLIGVEDNKGVDMNDDAALSIAVGSCFDPNEDRE
jgi:hypothetical protein